MIPLIRVTTLLLCVGGVGIICSTTPTDALGSTPQDRSAFIQIHGGIYLPKAFNGRRNDDGLLAFGASYGNAVTPHWSIVGRLVYATLRRTDYTIPASWGESYVKASREHQWMLQGMMGYHLALGESGIFAASGGLACTLRHYTYEMTVGPDTFEQSPALWGPVLGVTLESPLGIKGQSPLSLVVDAQYTVAYGYDRGDLGNHGGFVFSLGLGYSFGSRGLEE